MRQSLLTTAMICGAALTLSVPAYAQTPSPPPSAPATPQPEATAPPPPAPPAASPAPSAPPAPPSPPPAPEATGPATPPTAEAPQPPKPKPMMTMSGASNLSPADTKSDIAPKLPAPKLGPDAGPAEYLAAAKKALAAKNTGEAQEALEMAETRALDRVTPADEAGTPDSSPLVGNIHAALSALGKKDMKGAAAAVDKAIAGAPMAPMSPKPRPMKPMHPKTVAKPKQPAPPA